MNCQKRCEDCSELEIKKKVWYCKECFGQKCEEIDECPLGITEEEVAEMVDKKVKVKTGAEKDKTKSTTAKREKKPDFTKTLIIQKLKNALEEFTPEVKVTNDTKMIEFTYEGETYKVNLTRNRKPK